MAMQIDHSLLLDPHPALHGSAKFGVRTSTNPFELAETLETLYT